MAPHEVLGLKLRNLLNDGGATRGTYDKVISLIKDNSSFIQEDGHLLTRLKPLLDSLKMKYCSTPPTLEKVITTDGNSQVTYDVIRFDIIQTIKEMLLDNRLVGNLENLVARDNQPFSKFVPENLGERGEILGSSWYTKTYDAIVSKNAKEFYLVPVIMYMDKTGNCFYFCQRLSFQLTHPFSCLYPQVSTSARDMVLNQFSSRLVSSTVNAVTRRNFGDVLVSFLILTFIPQVPKRNVQEMPMQDVVRKTDHSNTMTVSIVFWSHS